MNTISSTDAVRTLGRYLMVLGICTIVSGFLISWAQASPERVRVQALFNQSDFGSGFDFLEFKLRVDKIIDPSIDSDAVRASLDRHEQKLRSMFPSGAGEEVRLQALRRFVYKAGPWNDGRPFRYDLNDPYGQDVRNKTLADYLTDRAGNCVTMPVLMTILGRRIGLDFGLALAPRHVLVKYTDQNGKVHNLETTSGAGSETLEHYRKFLNISDLSVEKGVYFKRLNSCESAALLASSVVDKLMGEGRYKEAGRVADLLLEQYPNFVWAMSIKARAMQSIWTRDILNVYQSQDELPDDKRSLLLQLATAHRSVLAKAAALGWQPVDLPATQVE